MCVRRPDLIHFFNGQPNKKIEKNRCLSFKKVVTRPPFSLSYIIPCLTTALTRFAIKKTTRKNTKNKKSINKNFTVKTQYLNLKAPSNNVKMQSDKTLTTQKNQSTFFKPNNFKRPRNH